MPDFNVTRARTTGETIVWPPSLPPEAVQAHAEGLNAGGRTVQVWTFRTAKGEKINLAALAEYGYDEPSVEARQTADLIAAHGLAPVECAPL